jgi:hypothetical protein
VTNGDAQLVSGKRKEGHIRNRCGLLYFIQVPTEESCQLLSGSVLLDPAYVRSLQALRSFDYFKRNAITLYEGFETVSGDCGEMAKNILTAFLLEKTKTFRIIKPFYSSIHHFFALS